MNKHAMSMPFLAVYTFIALCFWYLLISTTAHDDKKHIWIIIYANLHEYKEVRLHLRSQQMFPSRHVFQKTLYIWDSSELSWQDLKDIFGSYIH